MLETIAACTAVVDVILLGIGGALLRYFIRLEGRLVRIETKLGIDG